MTKPTNTDTDLIERLDDYLRRFDHALLKDCRAAIKSLSDKSAGKDKDAEILSLQQHLKWSLDALESEITQPGEEWDYESSIDYQKARQALKGT